MKKQKAVNYEEITKLFERYFFCVDSGAILSSSDIIGENKVQLTESDINGNISIFSLDLSTARIVNDNTTLAVKDLNTGQTVRVKFFSPSPIQIK